jgi:GNAT superfamily N-acetyltransferase
VDVVRAANVRPFFLFLEVTMTYELRPVLSPEEWSALHAIRRASLFTEERHGDVVYDDNHPDDRVAGNQPFLLLLDDEPLGVVRVDFRGREAVVRLVGITPARQRQGHGSALSRLIDALARERGVGRLVVNSHHTAVGFYERTGWHRESWDATELVGLASDCVQMAKEI